MDKGCSFTLTSTPPEDLKIPIFFYSGPQKLVGIESDQSDIVSAVPRYNDSGESVEGPLHKSSFGWSVSEIGPKLIIPLQIYAKGEPYRLSHNEGFIF